MRMAVKQVRWVFGCIQTSRDVRFVAPHMWNDKTCCTLQTCYRGKKKSSAAHITIACSRTNGSLVLQWDTLDANQSVSMFHLCPSCSSTPRGAGQGQFAHSGTLGTMCPVTKCMCRGVRCSSKYQHKSVPLLFVLVQAHAPACLDVAFEFQVMLCLWLS